MVAGRNRLPPDPRVDREPHQNALRIPLASIHRWPWPQHPCRKGRRGRDVRLARNNYTPSTHPTTTTLTPPPPITTSQHSQTTTTTTHHHQPTPTHNKHPTLTMDAPRSVLAWLINEGTTAEAFWGYRRRRSFMATRVVDATCGISQVWNVASTDIACCAIPDMLVPILPIPRMLCLAIAISTSLTYSLFIYTWLGVRGE